MTTSHKLLCVGGLLACGLGLPRAVFAVSGCNNGYLMGTYNAQVQNTNFLTVLQTLNTSGGSTGSTSTAGATPITGGFGSNTNSLAGSVPGLGRYYFDGAGNIVGTQNSINTNVGSYTVNTDCTARITLNGGSSFDAVLVGNGKQVLFMETDSTGSGAVGSLQQTSSCVGFSYPASYGYSLFGGTQQSTTSGTGSTGTGSSGAGSTGTGSTGSTGSTSSTASTGGTGSTAGATGAVQFRPYSAIGTLSTDGNGNFSLTQTVSQSGAITGQTARGTYSVGVDCSLRLNFSSSSDASTGGFQPPTFFRGLVVDQNGGAIAIQPNATDALTGSLIVQ